MMKILESIKWARNTIKDRLMFGMEDSPLSAAYARERRASGVLMSCEKEIKDQQAKISKLEKTIKDFETLERQEGYDVESVNNLYKKVERLEQENKRLAGLRLEKFTQLVNHL